MAGTFGEAKRIKIHPAHHGFSSYSSDESEPLFAVKHLESDRWRDLKADFQREVTNLKRLSARKDKHIIQLLFTVERPTSGEHAQFFLIFPFATENLQDLWMVEDHQGEQGHKEWVLDQCIAFPNGNQFGILKLADSGVTTFHHIAIRSNVALGSHTKTYRPPESQPQNATKSRDFDIWSLGCVFWSL
ncbi:hypothetical protein B0T25DRAFT_634713 [Lasiosphaeria hispida]|uniref:Protein kinase domain-containing protein n=1 Tax=Lasiosphaeria hispida TaxID=260671 RepID=A0AAJ0H8H1_9PEZI|nr:hypothetical protein B0T25DRAFT_634713 [Lasiosphaeria hispida]